MMSSRKIERRTRPSAKEATASQSQLLQIGFKMRVALSLDTAVANFLSILSNHGVFRFIQCVLELAVPLPNQVGGKRDRRKSWR